MDHGPEPTHSPAHEMTPPALIGAVSSAQLPRRGAILIVEDRDDVREGLSQLLGFQGYVVFEAANGTEAFAHLQSNTTGIALILLDLLLPGTGGAEVRAAQLANPTLSEIPTVVVSSCSPDMDGSADLRAAAWLEKPFRFDQLLSEVRRFVVPEVADDTDLPLRNSSPVPPPGA